MTRRFLIIAAWLLVGLLADVVLNDLNAHRLSTPKTWDYPRTIPTLGEPGWDLRILMEGAQKITHGVNPYTAVVSYPPPPFAAVFFYPFTWLSNDTAYAIQYWILIAFNLASIALIAYCLFRSSAESTAAGALDFPLLATGILVTLVALSQQFHSYGFEFALERGNFDSYVLLLVSAAVTSLIVRPDRVWVPVVLLSAASHLKIYPAILFILPLLQSWRRALVPLVGVNLAMLLVFGIGQARAFFEQILGYMNRPYIWPGNHSIESYVNQVIVPALPSSFPHPESVQTWVSRVIAGVVLGVWAHGILRLKDRAPASRRWLVMTALSFPVMGALTSTSHDYKLVIYVLPLMVNLYLFGETFLAFGSLASLAGLILTLLCGVAIDHSMIIGAWPLLETKFPALFLLLLLTYFQTYVCWQRSPGPAAPGASSAGRSKAAALALLAGTTAVACIAVKDGSRGVVRPGFASAGDGAPDSAGYGPIKLQLKLPGTSAGIPEPILVCGRPGAATLVYLRLLPDSRVKVGVEFWGKGAFESAPFEVLAPGALITVACSFPCLYPDVGASEWKSVADATQRERHGAFSIIVNDVQRLADKVSYAQPAHLPRYYGRNPVGGSLVSAEFTGTVISAIQMHP